MVHWILCADEHGNAYYYNEETEECMWEKPADYHEEEHHAGEQDEMDEEMKSKIQKAMQGSKKPLDPEMQAKLDAAKKAQEEAEAARTKAVEAGEEHWVEVYDPESHRFYYHGQYSGAIQWDKPEHYVMAADDELMSACIKIQCAYRGKMARRKMTQQAESKGSKFQPHPPKPKPPPPSAGSDKPPPPLSGGKPPPPSNGKPPPPSAQPKPPAPSEQPAPPKPQPPLPTAAGVKETYSFSVADTEVLKRQIADLKRENEDLQEALKLKDSMLKQKDHQIAGRDDVHEERDSETSLLKAEVKQLELRLEHEQEEVKHLNEHIHEDEVAFEKLQQHMDQQQKEVDKKEGDKVAARKAEAAAEKEAARLGAVNRKLEKKLKEKKPQMVEAACDARAYEETDVIRLRDGMLAAREKELWMVEEERAKLCVQLDQVEEEVQRMQEQLVVKDMMLNKKKTEIEEYARQMKQLHAKVAKAKGQEQAMEVVSKQNGSLLQLLQTQEVMTEQEKKERLALQLELDQLKLRHRRQMETAAETEAEMLREKAEARALADRLSALHEKAEREHSAMKKSLEELIAKQALSVEAMRDELTQRRGKQYEQLAKLNTVEEGMRAAQDHAEGYKDQLDVLNEWKQEQDVRLAEARAWRESADVEVGRVREECSSEVFALTAKVTTAEAESLALKRQLRELRVTIKQMVAAHQEAQKDLSLAQTDVSTLHLELSDLQKVKKDNDNDSLICV